MTHIKQQKLFLSRQGRGQAYIKNCVSSTALDVTEGIFAVLYYVTIMGLTRCHRRDSFLHLSIKTWSSKINRRVLRTVLKTHLTSGANMPAWNAGLQSWRIIHAPRRTANHSQNFLLKLQSQLVRSLGSTTC